MRFHYCREGETLLSIARDEGVSPVRLIEDNALVDPDRLAVGQCLAIYSPSKLYTVRGGDTLRAICTSLGTSELTLRQLNPSIGERGILYPGQALALGRGEAALGALTVIGLAHPRISMPTLKSFVSALTYLVIIPQKSDLRSGFLIPKCESVISLSLQNGVLPFLAIHASALSSDLLSRIKAHRYRGVLLEASETGADLADALRAVHEAGLLAISRSSENTGEETIAEADLLLRAVPLNNEAFSVTCRRLASSNDPMLYKTALTLPAGSVLLPHGNREVAPDQMECPKVAYRRNRPILRDENDRPYFRFTRTKHGVSRHCSLAFEDLASIRKGLAFLSESLAAGIALDLDRISPAVATLLCYSFDIIRP